MKIIPLKSRLSRGSITVEASVVVPVVILSIIAILLLGLVLYQRALLQSAADRAASAGAASWKSLISDTDTGKTAIGALSGGGLYWRIFEAEKEEKKIRLQDYTKGLIASKNVLKPESTEVHVDITDYILYKRLEVTIESTYRLPGKSVLRFFGGDEMLHLRVSSCAVMDDPAEFIRNTDFILDIEKEMEDRFPELKNLGDKTREIFGRMQKGLEDFLN